MAAPKKRGLGKGLESLFGDVEIKSEDVSAKEDSLENESISYIDINAIKPNANQPRRSFDEEKIQELADSILAHGLIQPLVVRRQANGYEIVAGERRYRAARKIGLKTVPCLVRVLTDEENMLLAIIENVQREDLNPIEEALAISQMIGTYGLTQEQVSKSIAKSRPYITNSLRLLKLSESVREMVVAGEISAGHARTILAIDDEDKREELAKAIVREGLSVRDVEKIAGGIKAKRGRPAGRKPVKNVDVTIIEQELKALLGTKINIKDKGKNGKIEIEYYSREELERIIDTLKTLQ